MLKKAKFIKGLDLKEPKVLILAISMDNKKQTLEDFEAFVELANRHKNRISKVRVVLSCYLQRHYVGEEKALELLENWKKENSEFLAKFTVSKDEIKPESWKEIIADPRYDAELKKAENEYKNNKEFQELVDKLAKKFSWKKSFEDAKNYLIDECAGMLVLSYDGIIAYPHQKLNDAAEYFLSKYNSKHHYAGYEISSINSYERHKAHVNLEEILITNCFNLSKVMEVNGIFGGKQQAKFFEKFIQMKEEFVLNRDNEERKDAQNQTNQRSVQTPVYQ